MDLIVLKLEETHAYKNRINGVLHVFRFIYYAGRSSTDYSKIILKLSYE